MNSILWESKSQEFLVYLKNAVNCMHCLDTYREVLEYCGFLLVFI